MNGKSTSAESLARRKSRSTIGGRMNAENSSKGVDGFEHYMEMIGNIEFLTHHEEKALGMRIKSGDTQAVMELFESHLPFVVRLATQHLKPGIDIDDLIQVGNIELFEAAKTYDPDFNTRFSTHAYQNVCGAMLREIILSRNVHVPVNLALFMQQYYREYERALLQLKRPPTLEDMSNTMNISLHDLTLELRKAKKATGAMHKSADIGDIAERSIEDNTVKNVMQHELNDDVHAVVNSLPEDEQMLINSRFGWTDDGERSIGEIADKLGVARNTIYTRQTRIYAKLQRNVRLQKHALN